MEEEFESQEPSFDPEEAFEAANEVLSEMDEEELDQFFRKLEQDRVNDMRAEWREMYGFDHECSCAADAEEGRVTQITECYAGVARNALAELRRSRGFLYAIATAPTKDTAILKALAAEAFAGER